MPRYRSTFDIVALLESARQELATFRPEEYKILLLGAMAGLRRNEIDVLPWSAFRWNEGVIRIETTEFYRPKSHNSEASAWTELMEVFRGFSRGAKEFVIESDCRLPLTPLWRLSPYSTWALLGWLRSKGVNSKTPLHSLRKEFGSLIHDRVRHSRGQRAVAAWRHRSHRQTLS